MSQRRTGFTLIELLVVIAIIGILATLVVVAVSGAQVRARNSQAKSDISQMSKAIELVKSDTSNTSATTIDVVTGATGTVNGLNFATLTGSSALTDSAALGTPTITTMFGGTATYAAGVPTAYGVRIAKTPGSAFTYVYRDDSANGEYMVHTTVQNASGVTDTAFCIANGSTYAGSDNQAVPAGCTP